MNTCIETEEVDDTSNCTFSQFTCEHSTMLSATCAYDCIIKE